MPTYTKPLVFAFLLLYTILPFLTTAQPNGTTDSLKNSSYINSYWQNGIELLKSPAHWKGEAWSKAASVIFITGLTVAMDDAVSQPFFNMQSSSAKAFGNTGSIVGNIPVQIGVSGAAIGIGQLTHNQYITNFGLDNLQAQIFNAGINFATKLLANRARPKDGQGSSRWGGPLHYNKESGFYSGHTSAIFSTATMVFLHSKKKWWVGLISYTAATAVAGSRMQQQEHWVSDLIMGAAMGSAISAYVYKKQEERRGKSKELKIIP